MPYLNLLIHAVWTTKNRKPLLNKQKKDVLCRHINEYSRSKQIYILNINGWKDHVHCLISMASDQNLSTIMNLLKGESSFWANKHLDWNFKFGWQNEYYAVSVSPSALENVQRYIDKQEEHHKRLPFQEEYGAFFKKYLVNEWE